jgi:hypothetical protein
MAIGSDARSVGYAIVPDTGEEGRIRWGAREINRTRDYIALVLKKIPTTRPGWRTTCGITSGTVNPSGGSDGDIYFKII